MKRVGLTVMMFALFGNVAFAQGLWRVTPVVNSRWDGNVQIKWNAATGESYHSVQYGGNAAYGGVWEDWLNALGHTAWTRIETPAPDWKPGPASQGRFAVAPHVIFGDSDPYADRSRHRAAVFMIDTYSGATYVAALGYLSPPNGEPKNFVHQYAARGARWVQVEERSVPPVSEVGRYEISAVNSEYFPTAQGRLGPYLMRLDRVTGQADVAIPRYLFPSTPSADVVQFIWCPILNTDPGSDTTPACPLN